MENKNMETLPNAPSENKPDRVEMPASRPAASLLKLLRPGGYSTWLIYLLLLILFFLGVGVVVRFSQALNAQQENLRYRHQEVLLGLEAEMKSALNTVEGLRTTTQAYYTNPGAEPSPYYGMLAPRSDKGGYALERIRPPFSRDQLANLTGLGKLERDDASFRREIEMTLSLTPLFEWAKSTHPAAPWVYYTSARGFISMYPWVSADDFFFSPALYEHGFFSDGLPENNPDRRSFITEVYKDEAGQGLMVTIAAPVYEGDTFRGTVALDFTLAWLHQFFTQAQYTEEKAFIVNDRGQIVALSTVTTTAVILGVADVLPELKQDTATLLNLTPGQVHALGQYYVFVQPIQHTPWTYVAVVRWPYVLFNAAMEVVPVMLMLLLFMAAVVFVWQRARQESKVRALETQRMAQEQKAQAEIVEREHRFRVLVEAAPDGILIVDQEQHITLVNRQLERMFGYTREEIVGRPCYELLPTRPADWGDAFFTKPESGTLEQQLELQGQRQDGSLFPINVSLNPLEMPDGRAIIASIRDITESKQAEAEHARLQQEIIEAQQRAIAELSTPVIPIMDRIIVMPLIGSIDSMRARDITRTLLAGVNQHRAKVVILDVTGVGIMDTGIVNHLNKTIQAARLKGAKTIVTGISDAVAEAIVDLGIDWGDIETLSDLQTGLVTALGSLGVTLSKA
jgi:PAS domain S-box-containing protein